MAADSGVPRTTAPRIREKSTAEPTSASASAKRDAASGSSKRSSSYRVLGKDALLGSILDETANAAAAEEAVLSEELERKRLDEQARAEADEEARREAARASVIEEKLRRQRAQQVRRRVAREIEEEELRASGLWDRVSAHRREVAPSTDELAAMTSAELSARARDAYRPSELLTTARPRPWLLPATLAASVVVAGGLVVAFASSGSDIDPASYEKTTPVLASSSSPLDEIGVRLLDAPSDRDRRARRERRQRHATREAPSTDAERSSPASARPSDEAASQRRQLDISLDDAGDLWRVGSE